MIWCWEYVSGISDLAQLRIFYKLSRFGGWLWGSTCLAAQDSLVCKFPLLIQTATSPLGVTWLFLWSLPTLHVWGPNFRLYPGSSPKGREPTLCIPTFNTQVRGSTMEERTRQPSRWNGLVGWCQCLSSAFPVLAQHSHDVREEGYIWFQQYALSTHICISGQDTQFMGTWDPLIPTHTTPFWICQVDEKDGMPF